MRTTGEVLERDGADRRTARRFYVALVRVVLLFGSKTWVRTHELEKSLKGFHQWEARRMTGMGT